MTQEELVQEVLDRVLQSSTGVEDLETVTSLSGVKSLPGEKDGKMVNVPLELIGKPASDAAARAAEREGGADDHREGHGGTDAAHVVHIVGSGALRDLEADVFHRLTEQLTAFGLFDDFGTRTDELHAALRQNARSWPDQERR